MTDTNTMLEEDKDILKSSNNQLNDSSMQYFNVKDDTCTVMKTIRDTWWRFVFLGLCCLVLMGSYYCYDNPAPVQKMINAPIKKGSVKGVEHGMNMSSFQYELLYSLYSYPNILIPLFGGFFIDYMGKNNGVILFTAVVAVGQFFFALSTHIVQKSESFGKFLAFFGRFIFGLGGENLTITGTYFITSWFAGKELSFAIGTDLCASRIFTVINDATQPIFYVTAGHKLSLGFWFGFILCLVSFGCAIILVMLDNHADQISIKVEVSAIEQPEEHVKVSDRPLVSLKDLKQLPRIYWALTGSCVLTYMIFKCMSFMSFMNVASGTLQERFGFDIETTGIIMGVPYTIAAIATPFLGFAFDLYGLKTIFCTFIL
jgi:MFS family permease